MHNNASLRSQLFYTFKCVLTKQNLFILALISLFLLYFQTTLIVDWNDSKNWDYRKRELPKAYYLHSHYEQIPWLDCKSLLTGHEILNSDYREKGRIVVQDPPNLPMDCPSLKKRILSDKKLPSVKHSYAVSRIVYKDYFWLETVLVQTYSPDNSYCFAIDVKSSKKFTESMEELEKCFPNVHIAPRKFDYDSKGHFLNFGHFDCTELLLKQKGWRYIVWLQNYDIVLRTNKEMSQIMEFLNGSHSIGHKPAQWKRYAVTKNWSAKELKLWKKEGEMSEKQRNAVLDVSQNYNEVMLSRELVEFVTRKMNYKNLLEAFEIPYRFATDELFWATLIATADLQLPGAPTEPCIDNRYYILRYNEWEKWYNPPCMSTFSRHGTCIFGIEYLQTFSQLYQITANKVLPEFDYGFVKCYGELLYNRSYFGEGSPSSMQIYSGDSRVFC